MIQRAVCFGMLWLLLCGNLAARDIYVDNVAGDDRHDGRAPMPTAAGGPCRTIARALRMAQAGDRIVLTDSGRPYRESITLEGFRHSGTPEVPFVLLGGGAILDGSRPVPAEAWEHYAGDIYRFRPPRISHQQLFLDGRPLRRVPVDNNVWRLPALKPLQWCLFDGQIYLNLKRPAEAEAAAVPNYVLEAAEVEGWRYLPEQYDLSYAGQPVGITLYDVRNVVIADLIVQGYQFDGINAHDKAFDVSLVGVTARGNGRSGISIGGASRVRVIESLLGDNGAAQLRTEGYSHTEIAGSEILANTAPSVVRDGGEVTIDGLPLGVTQFDRDVMPPQPQP